MSRKSDKFEPEVRLAPIGVPKEREESILAWEKPSLEYKGPNYFVRAHENIPMDEFAESMAEAYRCSLMNNGAPVGVYQNISTGKSMWAFYKCLAVVSAKHELELPETELM